MQNLKKINKSWRIRAAWGYSQDCLWFTVSNKYLNEPLLPLTVILPLLFLRVSQPQSESDWKHNLILNKIKAKSLIYMIQFSTREVIRSRNIHPRHVLQCRGQQILFMSTVNCKVSAFWHQVCGNVRTMQCNSYIRTVLTVTFLLGILILRNLLRESTKENLLHLPWAWSAQWCMDLSALKWRWDWLKRWLKLSHWIQIKPHHWFR